MAKIDRLMIQDYSYISNVDPIIAPYYEKWKKFTTWMDLLLYRKYYSESFAENHWRELRRLVKFFFNVNSPFVPLFKRFVQSVISDIIVHSKYKDEVEDYLRKIDLVSKLQDTLMDYIIMGDSFLFVIEPFIYKCICDHSSCPNYKNCSKTFKTQRVKIGNRIEAYCPIIKEYVPVLDIKDFKLKEGDYNVLRLEPEFVDIQTNMIKEIYIYHLPGFLKTQIKTFSSYAPEEFIGVPSLFLKAIVQNKPILLKNNVYHAANPPKLYGGYGFPMGMVVLDIAFSAILMLRRHARAVLNHMPVMRVLTPVQGSVTATSATAGFINSKLRTIIEQWQKDPDGIFIAPIALQMQTLGGIEQQITPLPEFTQLFDIVSIVLGILPELIRGGAQWASMYMGARLLEESIKPYSNMLQRFLKDFSKFMRIKFNDPELELELKSTRAVIDENLRQIILRLMDSQVVSKKTALGLLLDMDYDTEFNLIKREQKDLADLQVEMQVESAKKQESLTRPETQTLFKQFHDALYQDVNAAAQIFMQMQPEEQQVALNYLQMLNPKLASEFMKLLQNNQTSAEDPESIAKQIMQLPKDQQQEVLGQIQQQNPELYKEIIKYIEISPEEPKNPTKETR